MSNQNIRELTHTLAILEAIRLEMRRDPSVIVLGEDVAGGAGRDNKPEPEGWFAARGRGLIAEFGPDRIIDTPIAEMGFVGAAVGAAMTGLRPIVDLSFIDLIGVCYDQIVNQAAKMHYMMGGQVDMPLVIRTTYGARPNITTHGGGAAAQHSQTMYSVLAHIPGLKVVVPSTPYNAKGLLISAVRDNGPVVFLENRFFGMGAVEHVPEEAYTVEIGKAEIVRRGKHVTIAGIGRMTRVALDSAERLAAEGIDAEVVDVLTLAPLDEDTIVESVSRTGRLVVVDEDTPTCSMARDIAARVADKAFDYLQAPIKTVTAPEAPVPFSAALEKFYAPNADAIIAAVHAQEGK
jgi:pyruvate dehydrogenase E1 component beta subunit